jgi:hypothetical protein
MGIDGVLEGFEFVVEFKVLMIEFILIGFCLLGSFEKFVVLEVGLLEQADLLLALESQQFVLLDEDGNEGVDGFDFLEVDDWQFLDEDRQLVLLVKEGAALEVVLQFVDVGRIGGRVGAWR